jgi:hypothetical protein
MATIRRIFSSQSVGCGIVTEPLMKMDTAVILIRVVGQGIHYDIFR